MILAGAVIALSVIVAFYFSKNISNLILIISKLLDKTSKLDLTYDKDYEGILKYKDETVQSIEAVSVAIEELAKGATNQVHDAQSGVSELSNLAEKINTAVNSSALYSR